MMNFRENQPAVVAAGTTNQLVDRNGSSAQRRGSLPFKKRRLVHHDSSPVVAQTSQISAYQPASSFRVTTHENNTAAALALLAAASGALSKMASPRSSVLASPLAPHMAPSQNAGRSTPTLTGAFFSSNMALTSKIVAHNSSSGGVGPSPVTPVGGEFERRAQPLSSPSSTSGSKPRVHHAPLSAPLPNGCHGRTSRNNSFCRRTPCYNGSRYCKLHHQQYIVAGTRIPVGQPAVSEVSSATCTPASTPTTHQDKRFTGCGDEIRCTATTTRGRACAYVSVTDGKYCYLHADYDTNPPPRRGGGSSSADFKKLRPLVNKKSCLDVPPCTQGCPVIPDLGSKLHFAAPLKPSLLLPIDTAAARQFPPSVSSDESLQISSSKSPQAEKSQALLSFISSDQWLNRKVVIATGPLVNRTGFVEKWGNGWVTVRVCDGLTHNRRSIELHLLPTADSCSSSGDEDLTLAERRRQVIPHCVSYEKDMKHGTDTNTTYLDRSESHCVEQSQHPLSHFVSCDESAQHEVVADLPPKSVAEDSACNTTT